MATHDKDRQYKKNTNIPRQIFIYVFILLIILPHLLMFLGIKKIDINGLLEPKQKPLYTLKTAMNGEYTYNYDLWYNENFFARGYYIKAYSQFKYSLFNVTSAPGIISGKDGYLFGPGRYIEEALGIRPPPSNDKMEQYVNFIKSIQDSCDALGKKFIFILPVHKAQLYLDKAPTRYIYAAQGIEKSVHFYDDFTSNLKARGVRFFDTLQYIKSTKPPNLPMFAKTGTHWNYVLTANVVKQISDSPLYNLHFNKFDILKFIEVSEPIYPDTDIMDLSNLIFPIQDIYYYPEILKSETTDQQIIFINGTSFNYELCRMFIETGIASKVSNLQYTRQMSQWDKSGLSSSNNANSIQDVGLGHIIPESDTIILSCNALELDPRLIESAYVIDHMLNQLRQERGL